MIVAVAADHAGWEMKNHLADFLRDLNYQILDLSAPPPNPLDDYPDSAQALGLAVRDGRADRGLLICGSGVGASVAVNKIRGVRGGLCHDHYSAHQSVEHDNANVLVLGSRIIGPEPAKEIVHAFLRAQFSGEDRHVRRLAKVADMEAKF
ncbi:MAG: RpiB/LacA/LacB family sugar-phosphate isomerase [Acidobacteriaceae bacterium]|nr:RpiB/LacA/LacB family sugar-phosphate isomerase [Acidobacteriaceae bacterium]